MLEMNYDGFLSFGTLCIIILMILALVGIRIINSQLSYPKYKWRASVSRKSLYKTRKINYNKELGKSILGIAVCSAVPLTMDNVLTFSKSCVTLNCWAWIFYGLLSIITVLCAGGLINLIKVKQPD